MMRRVAMVAAMAGTLAAATAAMAEEWRPSIERPEIIEVGDPILVSRRVLALEMRRNVELRDWVRLYGAPEYTEVQEIEIDPPYAPYEVRLYYLRRNSYLAFGRVHVSPEVYDYGVRKYIGPIDPEVMDRLLTTMPAPTYASSTTAPIAAPATAVVIETEPVEGVPLNN